MALDKILQGIMVDFIKKYQLDDINGDSKRYEYLVNCLLIAKYSPEAFSDWGSVQSYLDTVVVDHGSQFGLDAIAFIVNGHLVTSKEDLELYRKSGKMTVDILCIQAKTENKVELGDLLKEINAVKTFLDKTSKLTEQNENVRNAEEILKTLFEYDSSKTYGGKFPTCHVYYVTASPHPNDGLIQEKCMQSQNEMAQMFPDIAEFEIHVVGRDYIISLYNEINNNITATINLRNSITLDRIDGVKDAYIGYLTGEEYLRIICTQDETIRRHIFYENVRDYQGSDNSVNREIHSTLCNPDTQGQFIILNNGVTIITRTMSPLGSKEYEISGFQIVNGCQTSNEIYNAREKIANVLIPVKIIHTVNPDLIGRIVRATNRQSPVPEESFVALGTFHKQLEVEIGRASCRERV